MNNSGMFGMAKSRQGLKQPKLGVSSGSAGGNTVGILSKISGGASSLNS
jgi:hypothetical protein